MDGKLRNASIVSLAKVAPLVLCKVLSGTSDSFIRDSMVSGIGAAQEFLFVIAYLIFHLSKSHSERRR